MIWNGNWQPLSVSKLVKVWHVSHAGKLPGQEAAAEVRLDHCRGQENEIELLLLPAPVIHFFSTPGPYSTILKTCHFEILLACHEVNVLSLLVYWALHLSFEDFSSMPTLCRAVDDGGFGTCLTNISQETTWPDVVQQHWLKRSLWCRSEALTTTSPSMSRQCGWSFCRNTLRIGTSWVPEMLQCQQGFMAWLRCRSSQTRLGASAVLWRLCRCFAAFLSSHSAEITAKMLTTCWYLENYLSFWWNVSVQEMSSLLEKWRGISTAHQGRGASRTRAHQKVFSSHQKEQFLLFFWVPLVSFGILLEGALCCLFWMPWSGWHSFWTVATWKALKHAERFDNLTLRCCAVREARWQDSSMINFIHEAKAGARTLASCLMDACALGLLHSESVQMHRSVVLRLKCMLTWASRVQRAAWSI